MSSNFQNMMASVRRQAVERPARARLDQAQARHPVLAMHATTESLLRAMESDTRAGWCEREALTRALIAEQQRAPAALWVGLLLSSCYPILGRLRRRIVTRDLDSDELDQLVLCSFLQVVAELDLDKTFGRTVRHLRQRTARKVFRAIRAVRKERRSLVDLDTAFIEGAMLAAWPPVPEEQNNSPDPEQTIALLFREAAELEAGAHLDLVVSMVLKKEKLRVRAARAKKKGEPGERAYQRLKRRRWRAMNCLRRLSRRHRPGPSGVLGGPRVGTRPSERRKGHRRPQV